MNSFRNETKHECELPISEDVLTLFIQGGSCVALRRKLRRQLLVSETDYKSKIYFKSSFVLRRERLKHLRFHYYMIHPLSNFTLSWEMVMMVTFFLILIIIPMTILSEFSVPVVIAKMVLDLICLINVIIEMNTGYIDYTYGKINMKRHRVGLYRLYHWFFFDIISSFNYDVFWIIFNLHEKYSYIRYLAFVKLLRIISMFQYFDNFCERQRISIFKNKIFKLVILSALTILWSTAIIYVVLSEDTFTKITMIEEHYFLLHCFRSALQLLLNMGLDHKIKNIHFLIFEIIGVFVGFVVQIIIISQVIQIVNKSNYTRRKYYQITQQLYEFMRHKRLPNSIKKRIFAYFNYRFQQNYFKECEIMGLFSEQLRQEMMLHTHMHLLESVEIFSVLPAEILYKLISHMKSEVFLPADVIVTIGSVGECMLFVASGTAAIYTAAGKEVCHLSDGANFGELSLIMDSEHRMASVVAVDVCEILILQRKDFLKEVEQYPEIYDRIRRMAQEKVKKTLFPGEDSSEKISITSSKYY